MSHPSSKAERSPQRKREALFIWVVVALIGTSYFWSASLDSGGFISKRPSGYYGFVTDAFLSRQLNLKVAVDPVLAKLANPYAGAQGALRPHDMSYYKGK